MDWLTGKEYIIRAIKKYRLVLLVFLIGVFLMMLPTAEENEEQITPSTVEMPPSFQDSLADILSKISGAGKVEVLLTESVGEQVQYQTDDTVSPDNSRRDTVLITNADREEAGLVTQITPPVYRGAIVLCQGADNANVRLSIVQAVMSVTGLTSDHISVLKMK